MLPCLACLHWLRLLDCTFCTGYFLHFYVIVTYFSKNNCFTSHFSIEFPSIDFQHIWIQYLEGILETSHSRIFSSNISLQNWKQYCFQYSDQIFETNIGNSIDPEYLFQIFHPNIINFYNPRRWNPNHKIC